MKRLLAAIAFVALSAFGCATTPQTPAQAVYAIQGTYAAALQVAVTYKGLPSCTRPDKPVLCSDAATVKKVQEADNVAYPLLLAAQNTVRTPGAGANAQTAIVAAKQAVNALAAITATLRTAQ